MTTIGNPTAATTLGDIIQSIRAQIPDPVSDPASDGTDFTLGTLVRWVNDAMRIMATSAPIIQDWHAFQSVAGMDIYVLPSTILSVEQLFYDLLPCVRSPEALTIFSNKITARSFYFGPHSIHAIPRLQVWPAADRTGATTTLSTTITDTSTSVVAASTASMKDYGYIQIEDEIILYRTNTTSTGTLTNLLRGQAGTEAVAHNAGATVTELNTIMKVSRLPAAVSGVDDLIEIPLGLTPLIELYVLSKVREAEQESVLALQMRSEFDKSMEKLTSKAQLKGLRQGLQVSSAIGPDLYRGRVYIP